MKTAVFSTFPSGNTFSVTTLSLQAETTFIPEDIMYYTAMAAYKYAFNSVPEKQKERYMTFLDEYYNFVSEFPKSRHTSELDGLYKKVNKQIKKEE